MRNHQIYLKLVISFILDNSIKSTVPNAVITMKSQMKTNHVFILNEKSFFNTVLGLVQNGIQKT